MKEINTYTRTEIKRTPEPRTPPYIINNMINKNNNIDSAQTYDGVTFTRGPMHINHFYEISKCGVNALRLYQYIRTIQGLRYPGTQ